MEEDEEEVDSLVDWANQLSFDAYQQYWSKHGATRPAQRDK